MKRCPTCNRTFEDTFTFCLVDGSILSAPFDSPATLHIPHARSTDPPPTEVLPMPTVPGNDPVPPTIESPLRADQPTPLETITAASNELPRQPEQQLERTKSKYWLLKPMVYLPLIIAAALAMYLVWSGLQGKRDAGVSNTSATDASATTTTNANTISRPTPQQSFVELAQTLNHDGLVFEVAFSPDGKMLASGGGSGDKTVKLWDVASGRELRTLKGHSNTIYFVAFSPDGKTLASGSEDDTAKLWDVASGRELHTLKGPPDTVRSVAFSPDGQILASGSGDYKKVITLWDVASGRLLRTLTGHSDAIPSVAFAPDGKTLVSGSSDKTIKLWDVASGRLLRSLTDSEGIGSVAFSPDGTMLASSSRAIKLWDVEGGRELRTLTGHSDAIYSVAFSPDGKMLASGGRDKTIKLWDVASGQELPSPRQETPPRTQFSYIFSVAFSPDSKMLASSSDGVINLWRLND